MKTDLEDAEMDIEGSKGDEKQKRQDSDRKCR